jgi:hypothetical protein
VTARRHAQILGLVGLETTLGTRNRLVLVVLEPFPLDVVLTVADLAT